MNHQIIQYLNFLLKNKNFDLSEQESIKYLNTHHDNAEILNILGLSRFGLGKIDLSIESFKQALKIDNNKNYKLNLAIAYLQHNKRILAIKNFLQLFKENCFDYRLFIYLYSFSKKDKNKEKILNGIITIVKNNPKFDFNNLTINFLNFFINKEEYNFIKKFCTEILKIKKSSIVYNLLAHVHFLDEEFEEAEIYFHKSIELDPLNYSFYFDLAEFYKGKGSTIESISYYQKAINLNKELDGNLHRCFAYSKKYSNENDDHFKFLEKIVLDKTLFENKSDINKMHLLFSISKAYDDLEKFEEAHKFFHEANSIARKINPYHNNDIKKEFDIFKKIFSTIDIKSYMKHGFQNDLYKPIFIMGLPRSGSTLVEQIISSHSKVFSKGESKIFGRNLSFFFNTYDFDQFELDLSLIKKDTAKISRIGKYYIEKSIKQKQNKKFIFTDKMLFNFLYAGLIKICLPHSKIIICERDYRDIFISIIKNYFSEKKMGFAFDEELIFDFILLYDNVLKFWKKKLENLIFFNDYEELVKNQDIQVNKILSYCNLKWEDDILNFSKNKNFVKTLSNAQVRSKIYQSSLHSWKNYDNFYSKTFEKLNKLQNFTT